MSRMLNLKTPDKMSNFIEEKDSGKITGGGEDKVERGREKDRC